MKNLLFLFCFLVSLTTFGQVKKIELTFPDDGQWHYGLEHWKFVNPADTSLIYWGRFTGGYECGLRTDYQFQISRDAPNGFYEVYVNGFLCVGGEMVNGKRNGVWAEYRRDGDKSYKFRTITFINGTINGTWTTYYKEGSIATQNNWVGNKPWGIGFEYPKNGTIHRINHETGIMEILNEKGEVIETILPATIDD